MNNSLLFGKSSIDRIVNLEVQDSLTTILCELPDGSLNKIELPNYFWLLSNKQIDKDFVRLQGNLHYKWGKQYQDRQEFMQDRQQYKRYDCFSIYDERESAMVKDGYTFFKGMEPSDISLCATDIETTGLNPHNKDAKVLLITNTFRKLGKYERKLFCYDEYNDEASMLLDWVKWVCHYNPSIILGHNIFGFDLHYLNERAKYHGIELNLGRDNSALKKTKFEKKFRVDGSRDLSYYDYRIYGREIIDTMHLAYKYDAYSRKYNSYGLKPIMAQEGWETEDRQLYDGSKIRENYKDPIEWEKIKRYCEGDGDSCIILFDKMIPPFFYQAQSIAKPVQKIMQSASGSQLNSIMLRAYLQDGHSIPKADEAQHFEGAISEGYSGIYSNILKLDCLSMYPSLMLQYSFSPKEKDPNNYFIYLVKYFREERLKNKKKFHETNDIQYSHLEQSQKIWINSLYGALGAPGLNFNNLQQASLVTRGGRDVLNQAMNWVTNNKDLWLSCVDTDAIAFGYRDGRFISKEQREKLLEQLNNLFPEHIKFSDDGYFPRFCVFKAKTYVMLTEEGKIKYKGSALKSPKLERALKEFINKIVEAILYEKGNYKEIYEQYVKEALNVKDMARWSSRITISAKTLESTRTNETKIVDALGDSEYSEGDRKWVFFTEDEKLCLVENFNGDYNKKKLLTKLYKCSLRFATVLDKSIFINYALKKSENLLKLLNEIS